MRAPIEEPEETVDDDSDLAGPDLSEDSDDDAAGSKRASANDADGGDDTEVRSADVIPLRATEDDQ